MSTWKAKLFPKVRKCPPSRFDVALLSSGNARPDGLHRLKALQPFEDLLIARCVLNDQFRFSVDR